MNTYKITFTRENGTVGELIEILSDFDEDLPVYLRNDNGYTYGNITERTIIPSEDLEEGDDE